MLLGEYGTEDRRASQRLKALGEELGNLVYGQMEIFLVGGHSIRVSRKDDERILQKAGFDAVYMKECVSSIEEFCRHKSVRLIIVGEDHLSPLIFSALDLR